MAMAHPMRCIQKVASSMGVKYGKILIVSLHKRIRLREKSRGGHERPSVKKKNVPWKKS